MLETSRPLIVLLFRMSSNVWTNHDMTGEKMEKIKSVALLGAGAVGSYVIYGFSGCPNLRFSLVAEGARAERLKKDGCLIEGMGCPGGCVAGAGTNIPVAKGAQAVRKFVKDSTKSLPPKEYSKIELP